jgi:siroheme synthase (precorrin-2 oxidase/ferrochelatase)
MLLQLDSAEKNVLVIGGNKKAYSCLKTLVKNGAIVTVVAQKDNITTDLADYLVSGEVAWFNRTALPRDVAGKGLKKDLF